ncbi:MULTISPECIES: hypothetical protein [Vibrio]|uniref:hypothetical protein n=1 Tax=Vibrio TaxID=662 RepID=UPI002075881C|nr:MULTISPECIES: hypothetical protein [Vibrio]USD34285.1 hypothetical protein J8Z27_19815 [Vibrio sp. SCSIO 43186]USD47357.1 hypothetical protein J4N38_20220 [Vibrio sp. SCSIO 43145]USD71409.1 hypothetical protein J4N41_19825 [Vibrio sp. SCSIO 43139]USD98321.1 hypothetical protein CTT30_20020 [Vibrio coralliilyticus]
MQLICKFVPGNSVSRDVLDYILSPDECIGQLSRTRNLQDILRQLPKPLSDTLPQSAKKDTHSLLSSIKQRLVRAEWVALSSFARRTPLSDAQLEAYPALKMRIDQFAAEQPKKIIKANYKAVTDDVPLARNLSYTPVEPSPDKKIVIEFAGQWPSNAAYLILSATDNQKEKIAKPRKDSSKSHRSVAVFKGLEAEPRNLYLAIPISGSAAPLKLLLAENVEPVDASDEMDEWDNVLVPVRPLAYLDGSKSKDKASELRGGYLYVFWKGKLWREMAITDKGYYQDVDVEYYRSLYQEEQTKEQPKAIQREAEGFAISQFWVPYKVLGEVQEGENGLKVIFSPKQKRFNQIESLESDAALLEKSSTPLDELSNYSSEQAFSTQEFTSDVDNAKVHAVGEDDMPWLSDQQVLVRSYDQSNTVIAYVDGKNSGFKLSVETGLMDFDTAITHYAVLSDSESDWVLSEPLEYSEDNPHFATAILGGFPPKGKFTLQISSPGHIHHSELVFSDLTFEQILAWSEPAGPAPALEPLPEMSAEDQAAVDDLKSYMSLWREELGLSK